LLRVKTRQQSDERKICKKIQKPLPVFVDSGWVFTTYMQNRIKKELLRASGLRRFVVGPKYDCSARPSKWDISQMSVAAAASIEN
jgi:hypothetical protein